MQVKQNLKKSHIIYLINSANIITNNILWNKRLIIERNPSRRIQISQLTSNIIPLEIFPYLQNISILRPLKYKSHELGHIRKQTIGILHAGDTKSNKQTYHHVFWLSELILSHVIFHKKTFINGRRYFTAEKIC